jgi:Protein of unknown function (DUF2628)
MRNLYEAAIGQKNTAYYLEKFQRFDQKVSGVQASWNWPAFLFGGFWLLYRKMHLWFFACWVLWVGLVCLAIFSVVDSSTAVDLILIVTVGLHILVAIYGNSFYYNSVLKKIEAAKLTNCDEESLEKILFRKGGVSTGQVASFLGFLTLIITLIVVSAGVLVLYVLLKFFDLLFCHSGCMPF